MRHSASVNFKDDPVFWDNNAEPYSLSYATLGTLVSLLNINVDMNIMSSVALRTPQYLGDVFVELHRIPSVVLMMLHCLWNINVDLNAMSPCCTRNAPVLWDVSVHLNTILWECESSLLCHFDVDLNTMSPVALGALPFGGYIDANLSAIWISAWN